MRGEEGNILNFSGYADNLLILVKSQSHRIIKLRNERTTIVLTECDNNVDVSGWPKLQR